MGQQKKKCSFMFLVFSRQRVSLPGRQVLVPNPFCRKIHQTVCALQQIHRRGVRQGARLPFSRRVLCVWQLRCVFARASVSQSRRHVCVPTVRRLAAAQGERDQTSDGGGGARGSGCPDSGCSDSDSGCSDPGCSDSGCGSGDGLAPFTSHPRCCFDSNSISDDGGSGDGGPWDGVLFSGGIVRAGVH